MDKQPKQDMVAVPLKEFLSAKKLPVDIFIRLSDTKYVQLFKAGDELQMERIKSYEHKEIDMLYVRKEEYGTYVNEHLYVAGVLLSRAELENRRKSVVVSKMTTAVLKELDGLGFSAETFSRANEVMNQTVHLVEAKINLLELFESLIEISDEVAAHSMAVSAVSAMIANAMGWKKRANLEKVSLAGLLHDIGKKEFSPSLLNKPRAQMTPEEIQLYETHTFRGVEILTSVGSVPDEIIRIVHEHHEKGSGQGYPRRLTNMRIHPMARVVGLANEFCNLTMKNANCPHPRAPESAVDYIEKVMGQPFDKDAFKALRELVSTNLKKIA